METEPQKRECYVCREERAGADEVLAPCPRGGSRFWRPDAFADAFEGLECGHGGEVHAVCLARWLETSAETARDDWRRADKSPTCPVCRAPVSADPHRVRDAPPGWAGALETRVELLQRRASPARFPLSERTLGAAHGTREFADRLRALARSVRAGAGAAAPVQRYSHASGFWTQRDVDSAALGGRTAAGWFVGVDPGRLVAGNAFDARIADALADFDAPSADQTSPHLPGMEQTARRVDRAVMAHWASASADAARATGWIVGVDPGLVVGNAVAESDRVRAQLGLVADVLTAQHVATRLFTPAETAAYHARVAALLEQNASSAHVASALAGFDAPSAAAYRSPAQAPLGLPGFVDQILARLDRGAEADSVAAMERPRGGDWAALVAELQRPRDGGAAAAPTRPPLFSSFNSLAGAESWPTAPSLEARERIAANTRRAVDAHFAARAFTVTGRPGPVNAVYGAEGAAPSPPYALPRAASTTTAAGRRYIAGARDHVVDTDGGAESPTTVTDPEPNEQPRGAGRACPACARRGVRGECAHTRRRLPPFPTLRGPQTPFAVELETVAGAPRVAPGWERRYPGGHAYYTPGGGTYHDVGAANIMAARSSFDRAFERRYGLHWEPVTATAAQYAASRRALELSARSDSDWLLPVPATPSVSALWLRWSADARRLQPLGAPVADVLVAQPRWPGLYDLDWETVEYWRAVRLAAEFGARRRRERRPSILGGGRVELSHDAGRAVGELCLVVQRVLRRRFVDEAAAEPGPPATRARVEIEDEDETD